MPWRARLARRCRRAVVSAWSQAASSIRVTGPRASGSSGRSRSKGVSPSSPASSMPGSTSVTGIRRTPSPRIGPPCRQRARAPPRRAADDEITVRGTARNDHTDPSAGSTGRRLHNVVFVWQILGGLLSGRSSASGRRSRRYRRGTPSPCSRSGPSAEGAAESTTAGRCAARQAPGPERAEVFGETARRRVGSSRASQSTRRRALSRGP